MKGAFLITIFFLVRFAYPYALNPQSLPRLQAFAPMEKGKWAYVLYQLSNIVLIISPLFLNLDMLSLVGVVGLLFYVIGLVILVLALRAFSLAHREEFVSEGIYRFSRHPMYLAYFFIFLGIGILGRSWLYLIVLLLFQIAGHFIVLAEEAWCLETYGEGYQRYMDEVRRYI